MSMLRLKAIVFQFVASLIVDTKGGGDIIYQKVDGENGPIRVLKYMPSSSKQDRYPVHVHMHGGGFVAGKADMDNAWCRRLADETASAIISIDYAKAPQHPFPAALHDVRDVILSLSNDPELDVSSLTIGGLSAGGNLSIAWALVSEEARAKSISPWLTELLDKSYTDDYENMLVSPRHAPATLLAKFPKTMVLTAGLDCLHVEGGEFANQLSENGVEVIHHVFPDAAHGYGNINAKPGTPDAIAKEESLTMMIKEIKKAHNPSPAE